MRDFVGITFRAFVVREADPQVKGEVAELPVTSWRFADRGVTDSGVGELSPNSLTSGEVLIRVVWSSLNYKDALAAQGHPGVAGPLPHVPGIDAAGIVVVSNSTAFQRGEEVVVTGNGLGAPAWGGWSEIIRVPDTWVVRLPSRLSLREAMVIGTAGFTAAQGVLELQRHGIGPESAPIVVTGATGGVGSWSIRLLRHLGYLVHAVTGKLDQSNELRSLGASEVFGREELADDRSKPLASARWGGGIDTVGGESLVSILKRIHVGGCVAACGHVGGPQLEGLTVFPFILRGVKLAGITSALAPRAQREKIWDLFASDWRTDYPDSWVEEENLQGIRAAALQILEGKRRGRTIINLGAADG